ncbi:hypothetical protein NE237_001199 [Protea cynaroides]|uniref:Thiamine pyrophosphate enzyme N-terminal TPP-binding domain-containing protein n=1 Tax=Protea cynaroides TaxID=273540 RepID=A0A9Q0QXW2_9MAGN|nr:hypothetical protein NE237_001199 [Protea cynaroides]
MEPLTSYPNTRLLGTQQRSMPSPMVSIRNISLAKPSFLPSSLKALCNRILLSIFTNYPKSSSCRPHLVTNTLSKLTLCPPPHPTTSIAASKGFNVLVEALDHEDVTTVFTYRGGASMEIHQALTCSSIIRNVLSRHDQGGIFIAEGYVYAISYHVTPQF